MLKPVVLGIGLLGIGACSQYDMSLAERTVAYKDFVDSTELEEKRRVLSFEMDGWTALSDEHMIVRHRVNRYYLLTMSRPCYDLANATTIIYEQRDHVLEAKFDWITVAGQGGIPCYIKTIHQINKDQRKALLDIGRKKDEAEG